MSALRVTGEDVLAHLERGGSGVIAEPEGKLAGSALWEVLGGGLYLSRLAVVPCFRRRGIARKLIEAAELAAHAQDCPLLHLSTRLVLENARRLFASCGFVEVGQSAHPGYMHPTMVRMEKRLR
jgi:ribosomal protein S18 acetylase RimI-like enzyme